MDAFTGLGIDFAGKKLVVVKSTQHFQTDFARAFEGRLSYRRAGGASMNFAELDYRLRDLNYWPRVSNPFASVK